MKNIVLLKFLSMLLRFPYYLWVMCITYMPGPSGYLLRYRLWKKKLKYLGENVRIDIGVYFQNPEYISIDHNSWIDRHVIILAGPPDNKRKIHYIKNEIFKLSPGYVYIGEKTHIAPNCVISGIGGLYIGSYCGIASNSSIYSFSHHYRNLDDRNDLMQYAFTPLARIGQQAMILGPVFIDDYSAIGLNTVVLPGTYLDIGCWVATGSIVSGIFPKQTLLFSKRQTFTKKLELSIKQ